MKKLFAGFDDMLTPQIIGIVYVLGLIGVALMFLAGFVTALLNVDIIMMVAAIIGGALGVVGIRIWCELLIVIFKIHENLRKMANNSN